MYPHNVTIDKDQPWSIEFQNKVSVIIFQTAQKNSASFFSKAV